MRNKKQILHIILFISLIITSILTLSSCDKECRHQWIEADCLYPKTCAICQQTEGDALGHNYTLPTCTEPKTFKLCGQTKGSATGHFFYKNTDSSYLFSEATNSSPAKYYYSCAFCKQKGTEIFEYGTPLQDSWGYNYYIDNEFLEKTDEWYVTTMEYINGTFENSATENSPLLVEILYDCNGDISIFLYEYANEDNLVKNSSSKYKDYYTIIIKNDKGQTYEARGQMWPGGDRIYIIDTYLSSVLNLMKSSQILKFYIECEDSPTTQYRFEVDMTNFNDVVNDMQ